LIPWGCIRVEDYKAFEQLEEIRLELMSINSNSTCYGRG
jgi:hypothetical protein